jgi:radical SAM/Cys-rich protein
VSSVAIAPIRPGRFPALTRGTLTTVQVNLGYRCNQACSHCHVEAGPARTEMMTPATAELVRSFIRAQAVGTVDLTGGAPELNPVFRDLVASLHDLHVIDRCNLTVLEEPGQADLAEFLARYRVHVVASLPCYSLANVDAQRGNGVFERSLAGIRRLNALGYGTADSGRVLDFVYNPGGAFLPPEARHLEHDYRRELGRFGVRFNRLLTLTNMPIKRFRHSLERAGRLRAYQNLLEAAFEPANLEHVMCRSLVSIDWQGYLYDCDFNQMLGLSAGGSPRVHVAHALDDEFAARPIAVGEHCFGCTAGRGSSCGGALT